MGHETKRNVIAIGASSGGVGALEKVFKELPAELSASVMIVLHLNPDYPSFLHSILSRAGSLPVMQARDGMPLEGGKAYVAAPDRHLVVDEGRLRLVEGPRENGYRPAIDPFFLSAARTFGARLIGVVLTGALDDGAEGLRMVKDHGGATVVQDPEDADFEDMPRNAIGQVEPDLVVPLRALVHTLLGLLAGCEDEREPTPRETMRNLEERSGLLQRLAAQAERRSSSDTEERLRARAAAAAAYAGRIRETIQWGESPAGQARDGT